MTTLEHDPTLEEDATPLEEEGLAIRTFPAELHAGDGRTVDLRIVPYGERIVHNDGLGGVPRGVQYTEEIVPGVFDHQIKAANRVLVNVEHEEGIAGIVGHGLALRSEPDGFHGSFRIHATPAGETALTLVREGILRGASIEARFLKSLRSAEGVVKRIKGQLFRVALCQEPAYAGSVVLGLRTPADETPVMFDEEWLPLPFDNELALRIAGLGITIPDRLLAHPATDTPSAEGTP